MGCCGGTNKRNNPASVTITNRGDRGVRAQPIVSRSMIQRRCPKCRWPMNSIRRFNQITGGQTQIWVCLNRKCAYKEG
jgi:hypothetical protein